MDHVDRIDGPRVLCTTLGRAQFAERAATEIPQSQVSCHLLDLYQAQQTINGIAQRGSRVEVFCSPDFPDGPFDAFAMPIQQQGDGELVCERLQAGFDRLRIGGRLLLSTDNPKDTWLRDELKRHTSDITRIVAPTGIVYVATKRAELKKRKDYAYEFACRDHGRKLALFSRPSVFSHRRLDPGARALMESMVVNAGDRVLDIGCGYGVLSIAAAARAEGVHVTAIDSNPRAVECTLLGAAANGLESMIDGYMDDEGACVETDTFDLVIANPPYYSNDWMAEVFVEIGLNAMKPTGRLQIVTQRPKWYAATLPFNFGTIEQHEFRDHVIFVARDRFDTEGD